MSDQDKTREQLIDELNLLRRRVAEFSTGPASQPPARGQNPPLKGVDLKDVLDHMDDGVYVVSADYNIQYINPVIEAEFGPVGGRKCYEYFHGLGERCPWCKNEEVFNGRPVHWEWQSPGNGKYYDLFDMPLTNPDGTISKLEIFHDITGHRQAEEKLKNQMEFVSTLMDTIPNPIFFKDGSGRYMGCNQAFGDLFGVKKDDVAGRGVYDMGPEDIVCRYEVMDRELLEQGGRQTYEWKVRSTNGTERDVIFSKAVFPDAEGRIAGLVGVMLDITERKRAEELLQSVFDQPAVGVSVLSPEGAWLQFNQRLCDILGYSREELMKMDYRAVSHPEDVDRDVAHVDRMVAGQRSTDAWVKRYIRKDGQVIWVRVTTALIRTEGGKPKYFVTITEDVTEIRRADEERKLLRERLQRAEKMEALGLLAGGVAHDLNNTLGILVGYSELLYEALAEEDPLREDARNIMLGGERASAIVQDLLALARRGAQTKVVTNLNRIVAEYLHSPEFFKLTSFHPLVHVRTELDEGLLKINGSRIHLSKTLMNLVSNAVEAMASGGEVVIRTENRYLDRPVSGYDELLEGDYVVLSVSDEGDGISNEDMKRIFEPFYTKKVMGRSGTGLGLSVVWGTVKDHDGYIDVQGRPDKGMTFSLYFPITDEETASDGAVLSADYMGRGERILVVDDVPEQREMAKRILSKLNYLVETASGGVEAVEYLQAKEADLIVLDMIMEPGMDGFETYRRISKIRPGQRAIIVSGFAETERVKMAQALGAGAFVRKPYIKERIGLAARMELDRPN